METALEHRVYHTYDEYLGLEATCNVKQELHAGHIFAMAGRTPEHAPLQVAVSGLRFAQLRGGTCRGHSGDLRARAPSGLANYPDVTIVRGRSERDPTDANSVINPRLIVEVTSRSSEPRTRHQPRADVASDRARGQRRRSRVGRCATRRS